MQGCITHMHDLRYFVQVIRIVVIVWKLLYLSTYKRLILILSYLDHTRLGLHIFCLGWQTFVLFSGTK
jgi:hypothetical protein